MGNTQKPPRIHSPAPIIKKPRYIIFLNESNFEGNFGQLFVNIAHFSFLKVRSQIMKICVIKILFISL